jgi:TonB family protein
MKAQTLISGLLLWSLQTSAGLAQTLDSLPSNRHCKPHTDARWVTFAEIGDTVALTAALREAADTGEAITYVTVDYGQDGRATEVHPAGARSHGAATQLESEFRTHLLQFSSLPKHFKVMVARLNATDHVALLPLLFTCPPERGTTPKADSILQEIGRLYNAGTLNPQGLPLETTLTGIWLDASGDIRAIWIERSSGDYFLDKKALDVVQAIHFSPPLIGSSTAPAILFMPVQFRLKGTTRVPLDPEPRRFP